MPASRSMLLEEFEPLLGELFLADCSPRAVPLRLIRAVRLPERGATRRPPFALTFHSAPEILLTAGNYVLRHERFGPDLISMAPVVAPTDLGSADGYYYEAIFN